jgi:hypothetical protein
MTSTADGLAPLEVEHDDEYVIGFPVYVGVTVSSPRGGPSFNRLPLATMFRLHGAFGLTLTPHGTSEPTHTVDASPSVGRTHAAPSFDLGSGASRRMLVDVGDLLPDDLAPGEYTLTLAYGGRMAFRVSAPFTARWREPDAHELATLARLSPERDRHGTWGQWTFGPPDHPRDAALPVNARDPLRFNRLVRSLLYGPDALAQVDPSALDVLDGVFTPEADAMRAELAAARDPSQRAALASTLAMQYPELYAWAEDIRHARGVFAWADAQRRRAP